MTISEIKNQVGHLSNAWEQFKSVNERRLNEIERKGSADPLTDDHLGKINHALDHYKERLNRMEVAISRPVLGGESKAYSPFANEYKTALCGYLRKGIETGLNELQTKSLSVASDPDGGYLVTPSMTDKIIRTVFETTPLRQLASVETISSDSLEIIEDADEAFCGWTAETTSISSDTETPQIGKKVIYVHELYAQPKATQKLLDDASLDIENWLGEKLADAFARKENTAFISGNGVGQPRGILTYSAGSSWGTVEQVASGGASTITADGLINLYYSLKEEYASRAAFLMRRATVQAVRLLKEATTNQYLWQPGLTAGAPDTLLGVPVVQAADMPAVGAGNLAIALADFGRAYQIVDRTGVRILRDPFTDKPFVKFYTTKRTGGDIVNFEAIKLMKIAAS